MLRLRSLLPSVHKLIVFEAAARHLNFTKAAAELGVTQSAVSNQIRELEEYTDLLLFRRQHRRINLTAEGEVLFKAVTSGFSDIAEALAELQKRSSELSITVTAPFGMTAFWLTNLIPDLEGVLDDTEIKLVASDKCLNLSREGIELGIRYGFGSWPKYESHLLFETAIFPVCSPAYFEEHKNSFSLTCLEQHRLLRMDNKYYQHDGWEYWYSNITGQPIQNLKGPILNSHTQAIMAAMQGKGVAIGSFPTESEFLNNGLLVRPFRESVKGKRSYYLVYPEDVKRSDQVEKLIALLREDAARFQQDSMITEAIEPR